MFSRIRLYLEAPLYLLYLKSSNKNDIERDVKRHHQSRLDLPLPEAPMSRDAFLAAALMPEFRSLFYYRMDSNLKVLRLAAKVIAIVRPGQQALFIACPEIGAGLYMSHAFATIITAKRIGVDCLISQQVTIGYSDKGGPPTIGDRVRVGAGAKVLGPIHLGDDCVIGANAVVVRDVKPGAVVGGVPAKVLSNAEDKYSAAKKIKA